MNTNAILITAAALGLAGCATAPQSREYADGMPRIVVGVSTRADVDDLMGKPSLTFSARTKSPAAAAYVYRDFFGYRDELWITYDDKGVVLSKFSERLGNG